MKNSAALLIALVFTGLALSEALSQTVSVPEVTELKAKYDEKVKLDVLRPHELAVADLNTKFAAALERSQEAAQKSGKLEEAIAIKTEKEAVQAGNYTPAADDTKTAVGLKTMRSTYRTALARLELDRDKKLRPLKDAMAKSLVVVIDTLTKNGKLEEAMAAKKTRDELIASVASATAAGSVKEPPPSMNVAGKIFVNSIGMKFAPIPGTKILICIHETRKSDYSAFVAENADTDPTWRSPIFRGVTVGDADDHPVSAVSWKDAQAFCNWLSKKENRAYRLPTDREWSVVVGISREESEKETPQELDKKLRDQYPWGTAWPPTARTGNFGDKKAMAKSTAESNIEGYDDGYATTAPVMSFKPNKFGIYDLGGNVWEWCANWHDSNQTKRVLRGASWEFGDRDRLLSSCRTGRLPDDRNVDGGFRCVLE